MYAVGRLGSYITRGVSTVSGPFHPFGGAVDIIVVEQPDGSFKSSPWYVRFGKFQGVLKAKEKIVNISVNGVEAEFHMYLDRRGEAYFLREVEGEDGDSVPFPSSSSSGDDTDGQSQANNKRPMKYKSCNFNSRGPDSTDLSDQKIVARTNSRRSRIFGLVFGRRSMKADGYKDEDGDPGVERVDSLERAEIAADLLEMKWSTNLSTKNYGKDAASRFRANVVLDNKPDEVLQIEDKNGGAENPLKSGLSCEGTDSGHQDQSVEWVEHCVSNGGEELPRDSTSEQVFEISTVRDSVLEEQSDLIVEETRQYVHSVDTADKTVNVEVVIAEIPGPVSETSSLLDQEELKKYDGWDSTEKNADFLENGIVYENRDADKIESCAYWVTSETFDSGLHASTEHSHEETYLASGEASEVSSKTIEAKTVIPPEDIITEFQAEDVELDKQQKDSQQTFTSPWLIDECIKLQDEEPVLAAASFDKIAEAEPTCGEDIRSMISVTEKDHLSYDDKSYRDNIGSELKVNLETSGNAENCHGDCLVSKTTISPTSESSEEEQFPFSDLDGFNVNEVTCMDAVSPEPMNEESHPLLSMQCGGVTDSSDGHEKSCASSDFEDQENSSIDPDSTIKESNIVSSPINISRSHGIGGDEGMWLVESMPNMRSHVENVDSCVLHVPLGHSLDSNYKSLEFSIPKKEDASCSSSYACKEDQLAQDQPNAEDIQGLGGTANFPFDPAVEVSLCRHLLYVGMGADAASQAFDAEKLDIHRYTSLGPSVVKDDRLVVRIGGRYFPWDAASPILLRMALFGTDRIFEPKGMIAIDKDERTLDGDASKAIISPGGSWRIWPFSFKSSKSRKAMYSVRSFGAESVSEIANSLNADELLPKPEVVKKMARAMTPTSKQLASLNLKEGSNLVTFTFSTAMLGKQQVDARIYLWKWNTHIIISDVDGTITRSDVLGQFMPLVGVDWSQSGVAHLFSAIKENGYQLLFLSARAISQAYHTRRFLFNIKQDGKTLPDGPVVISPDGLFPSLFREVIRRAPHEFKIGCLEEIRALFPPDHNPFYAGFGNRNTDEISYLKVGIPKGKVFTINPKGEVAVNKHVDTRSYTSLHALVHGMFPPIASVEQEDFNSWNFWKLPPATIDI
ncbi:phosphatidate phosphatase PAH2-like isoform X2 [Syzygium oleosum]|uniref:phosphatidate phosphatase PAH2-like isoform X2 n=1 Tax=Syzygium oleosum TaxID=219896 RepID=UPI0011D2522B|nr:phosphatidate phosphatase PAH2-like isoform X2 [Syzygium oleosum]